MSILFFANSVRDFTDSLMGTNSDSLFGDSDYVAYPFPVVPTNGHAANWNSLMEFQGESELDDEIWFHIRMAHANTFFYSGTSSSGTGTQIQFRDEDDTNVFELCTVSGAVSIRAIGDTTVTTSSSVTISSSNSKRVLDIKLVVSAATIEATLTVSDNAGTVLDTVVASADNTTSMRKAIRKAYARWRDWRGGAYSHGLGITEIIVTNGEPTLGWRLASLKPDAQGQYTQWLGDFSDITAFWQDFRFLASAESGIRESWTTSAYLGATSGYEIRGVGMKLKGERGFGAGPQSVSHMIVLDGEPYEGPEIPLTGLPTLYHHVWDVNPATEVAWDFADFSGWEFGVRSGA